MDACIFCKIIKKEIPATLIYQDELVTAFLDIAPINKGHVLVIPNQHFASPASIDEVTAGRVMHVGAQIGIALKRALGADGYNLHLADGTAAGQVVGHMHLHVVPRFVDDHFHWNWRQLAYDNGVEMDDFKVKIIEKLRLGK